MRNFRFKLNVLADYGGVKSRQKPLNWAFVPPDRRENIISEVQKLSGRFNLPTFHLTILLRLIICAKADTDLDTLPDFHAVGGTNG
jgi:hypothetical protein